jgi:hypothetical protein
MYDNLKGIFSLFFFPAMRISVFLTLSLIPEIFENFSYSFMITWIEFLSDVMHVISSAYAIVLI